MNIEESNDYDLLLAAYWALRDAGIPNRIHLRFTENIGRDYRQDLYDWVKRNIKNRLTLTEKDMKTKRSKKTKIPKNQKRWTP